MFAGDRPSSACAHEELDYWLRRAEQESVAAIRASGEAAARHDAMALAYSHRAWALLDRPADTGQAMKFSAKS